MICQIAKRDIGKTVLRVSVPRNNAEDFLSALHAVYHDRRDSNPHFAVSSLLRSCFELIAAPHSESLIPSGAVNNSHFQINTLEITSSRDRHGGDGYIDDKTNPNVGDTVQRTENNLNSNGREFGAALIENSSSETPDSQHQQDTRGEGEGRSRSLSRGNRRNGSRLSRKRANKPGSDCLQYSFKYIIPSAELMMRVAEFIRCYAAESLPASVTSLIGRVEMHQRLAEKVDQLFYCSHRGAEGRPCDRCTACVIDECSAIQNQDPSAASLAISFPRISKVSITPALQAMVSCFVGVLDCAWQQHRKFLDVFERSQCE